MNYKIEIRKQALKDYEKIKQNAGLKKIVKRLLEVLEDNPLTLPYEKLSGNLSGAYSKRINRQHRLVYTIDEQRKLVRILSMWSHYENV